MQRLGTRWKRRPRPARTAMASSLREAVSDELFAPDEEEEQDEEKQDEDEDADEDEEERG